MHTTIGVRAALVSLAMCVLAAAAGAQTLTIADAVAQAQRSSPFRAAAQARLDAAATAERLATRLPNPAIEVRVENWGAATPTGLPLDTFAVLTQPIELGGKPGARRDALRAAHASAVAASGLTDRELAREVVNRYVEVLRQRGLVESLLAQSRSLGEVLRVLEYRAVEGTVASADLRKIETERARVESQTVRASVQLEAALAALNAWLGSSAATAVNLIVPALPLAAKIPERSAASIADAIEQRPDVASARARVARTRALLGVERASGIPDLLVSSGYKRTAGVSTGVLAFSVPIALFDRNRPAMAAAAGEVRAAELELAFTRNQARSEALAQAEAARRLVAHALTIEERQAAPAAMVRTAARAAFEEGAGDLLHLLDAQRVHAEAVREVLDVRLDAFLAVVNAKLAAGEDPLP